jgi:ribonuclease Y
MPTFLTVVLIAGLGLLLIVVLVLLTSVLFLIKRSRAAVPIGGPQAPASPVADHLALSPGRQDRYPAESENEVLISSLRAATGEASSALEDARAETSRARAEAAEARSEAATARAEAHRTLVEARTSAGEIIEKAGERAQAAATEIVEASRRNAERQAAEITEAARRTEAELRRGEERLGRERQSLAEQQAEAARTAEELAKRTSEIATAEEKRLLELERVAGLTSDAAKSELLLAVEHQAKREAAIVIRDLEAEARRTGEQRARSIVVDAIQRVASEQTAESVVNVLHLPSDEMKGRIIGREGRNIRTFESVTGVNLIIDDTPEAVLLSCFDPVRREVGRLTLEKLVLDGRIHPHRIEEVYEESKIKIGELCLRAGEDALVEVGISDLHPELLTLLGRLRYRTSYGQNVLKHLVETAHIAGIMAAELGLDPSLVRRGAFLHDIGKALTHEVEGSHALIGADLARRYGEHPDVVHAIEAHHNEVAPRTIEAVLTQAADACSGGRPGARRESLEAYVKRLERIEEIAATRPGVDRVFAMQAGREVRVMVSPDDVDDLGAQILARDVAKQIEEELTYPGQIRITVVRESRATEIAR